MNFTDLRLKLIRFFQNNKYKVYIGIIILTIIIAINIILGRIRDAQPPSTIYEPHTPIISGEKVSSKKVQNEIESKIKEYMDYCKEKNYEPAYNLLSDDCKEYKFKNNIENFKIYVNAMFNGNKIYSIQDYSNKDNVYIYEVSIFEDIMATGMNNKNSDEIDVDKIVITKDGDNYKMAVDGFINAETVEKISEDENMKVWVEKIITYYDKVIYKVKVKNNTKNSIVIDRGFERDWINVSLNGELRQELKNQYTNYEKVIGGNSINEFNIEFPVYFDESKKPTTLTFSKVYVMERYTGINERWVEESNNAVKKYSVTINL